MNTLWRKLAAILLIPNLIFLSIVAATATTACLIPRDGDGNIDLAALADRIGVVRQDVADLSAGATPHTREKVARLSASVVQVEEKLRLASSGGPVVDVKTAANAALLVAESVVQDLQASGQDVGDLLFAIGVVKVAIRHVSVGAFGEAEKSLEN